jgi:sialic acid synthase SpsE
MTSVRIAERDIGDEFPTYFVADISANHDGDLGRARELIHLAAQAGADAAKFQNFRAPKIVSARGFGDLGKLSHQASWKRSVVEVYDAASLPWEWTVTLEAECGAAGIHYFSSPYDLEAVDMLDPHVPAFKIGSGDITWPELLQHVASKGKPVLLATGASSITDVERAVATLTSVNPALVLMQCNTNYTGSLENFRYLNLRVLETYRRLFPGAVLGLSDHTPGHAAVLGAITLGARAIEKHFTDDNSREGPDHPFSMTPRTWREMVDNARELELALGSTEKEVTRNERDTVVVQRRSLRAVSPIPVGSVIEREMLVALRPAPPDAIMPYELDDVVGSRVTRAIDAGEHLTWSSVERRT